MEEGECTIGSIASAYPRISVPSCTRLTNDCTGLMRSLRFHLLPGRSTQHHVAVTRILSGETTVAHTHDFPECFLVTAGSGRHFWNGHNLPVARGYLVWISARDTHHFQGPRCGTLEIANLALAPSWWRGFASLAAWPPPDGSDSTAPLQRRLPPSEIVTLEWRLQGLFAAGESERHALIETVASIVRLLGCGRASQRNVDAVEPAEWLRRLATEIADSRYINLPLSHWQKRSGRSPEHLARSCRRFFGTTLSELRLRARMEYAKDRLLRTEDKLVIIALEAGFQNLSYFYRVFRRREGCTPQVWRRSHAANVVVPREGS